MASYHDFAEKFESGMKIMEIVNEGRSAGGRHTGIKLIMTS